MKNPFHLTYPLEYDNFYPCCRTIVIFDPIMKKPAQWPAFRG